MRLEELFAEETTNPSFEGIVVTENMVLAVDCSKEQNVDIDDYAVVQAGLKSTSGSLNPEEKTNSYIRQGKSTTKTGTQREIGFELDRYVGDEFQDYALSHDMLYAIGQKAIVNYAYFNMITGVGEKGKGTLSISSDAEKMSQLLALREKVAQAPDIRLDKVEEVMNQMKNPDYINDTVLSEVADRLMEIFKI